MMRYVAHVTNNRYASYHLFAQSICTSRVARSTYTVVPLENDRVYFQRFPGTFVLGGDVGMPSGREYSGHHRVPSNVQQSVAQLA